MVQDFLNTAGIEGYGPDLLADTAVAAQWVGGAIRTWSALRGEQARPPTLTATDVTKLRGLRATIAALVTTGAPPGPVAGPIQASFAVSGAGEVRLEPSGTGWRWLASALWAEILLAQRSGVWRRIKRCHNHRCGSTFYDRSKNNSGVWHDVKTCGNAANLRASRARRRNSGQVTGSPVAPT
ncbi:CGNR zinc finger domain-containing protein [Mycobacterium parmense]|nr:CGNR zinc finger domain-containing protein [Mycobacterium parmense]ORW59395.1 peptide chain release factor 2 [Mycobacterium parmense]